MSTTRPPVPVNIIAGGLGAGKTTAINALLQHRPSGERWAILINEYGEVGVDGALLATEGVRPNVEIREVAGGCICCSAGFMFEMSLVMLLQRRPDRLLIEPTGLATLTGIIETLESPGIRDAVDLRSVITLIDASRLEERNATPEEQDQVAAADILLANHVDRATPDSIEAFLETSRRAFPPRAHVGTVDHARIPPELLDLVRDRPRTDAPALGASLVSVGSADPGRDDGPSTHSHTSTNIESQSAFHAHVSPGSHAPPEGDASNHGHSHPTFKSLPHDIHTPSHTHTPESFQEHDDIVYRTHATAHAATAGWILHNACVFDADRFTAWVREASRATSAIRLKAVVRTRTGWWAYNIVRGEEEIRPAAWCRTSRVELVCPPDSDLHPQPLDTTLRACIAQGPME